jgi:hypothetical protein
MLAKDATSKKAKTIQIHIKNSVAPLTSARADNRQNYIPNFVSAVRPATQRMQAVFATLAILATMLTLPCYSQTQSLSQPATLVQQAGEQGISTGFMSDLDYSPPSTELFPDYRNGNQVYKELYVEGLEPGGGVFQPVIDWMDNNINPFKVMAKNNDRLVAESDNLLDQSLNYVSLGLINMLKLFIYNPNVAVDTPGDQTAFGQAVAGMSFYIRKLAEVVYAIALDLSLLFFILSIWRYWANAAIRGR